MLIFLIVSWVVLLLAFGLGLCRAAAMGDRLLTSDEPLADG